MGDLPGKFLGRRASEDKARRKDPCWPVGTVVESDKQPLHKQFLKVFMKTLTLDLGESRTTFLKR